MDPLKLVGNQNAKMGLKLGVNDAVIIFVTALATCSQGFDDQLVLLPK